jgi:cyclophilin family peptidyl-prolyl cis-trans isomerase|tara:strand:- start:147 stop:797 length:651 start_codon:yes stop_codon:yes gene_type:complete
MVMKKESSMTSYTILLRQLGVASAVAALAVSLGLPGAWADDQTENPKVLMETTDGEITIELFADKSPITVENFLRYVEDGHYDGTVFHRVISNFMIQGGGFTAELKEKPTRGPIVNESVNKLHNTRGTLAMARTNDPDSASAQFFINQRSNLRLDWSGGKEGYTVFGEVVDGMQIVDIISLSDTGTAQAQTTRGPTSFQDVPIKPIVILSISRLNP